MIKYKLKFSTKKLINLHTNAMYVQNLYIFESKSS